MLSASCGGSAGTAGGIEKRNSATPVWTDSAGDGTPDFLRLTEEPDRRAFRNWFAFLAESMFYREAKDIPAEVNDCAGLVRFAYREALRLHDGPWAEQLRLPIVPPWPQVAKYQYPYTPLGAALFRVTQVNPAGPPPSRSDFAEFADANTLLRWNTHFVGRHLGEAETGDLLFYRQLNQRLPFHVMIYLAGSYLEPQRGPLVVYHTGPEGGNPGEIRRPAIEELRQHPEPRWRPASANPNFLGIFRWNILKIVI
jgi:uncharacterized protein YfaT (DUF1175 family)